MPRSVSIWTHILALACAAAAYCAGAAPTAGLTTDERAPDFERLRRALTEQHLESIEDVLAWLPASYRSHYVLMFDSRSLHGSSPSDPRVLLYGADATFIVTFNGQPEQRGYRDLETMEYDATLRRFTYREIHFPDPAGAPATPVVSEDNPRRCAACHGRPAHPVWDTFPSWPGAYGTHYLAKLSAREASGLAAFLVQQKSHPRYRYLLDAERLGAEETFAPTAATRYGGVAQEPPNAEFSTLIGRLNLSALLGELESARGFAPWRYALLASLDASCGPVEELVPRSHSSSWSVPFAEFTRGTAQANERALRMKALRLEPGAPELRTSDVESLDRFRYLIEQGLGISTRTWTTALEKGTYDFALPGGVRAELERLFIEDLGREEPALGELAAARGVSTSEHYCAQLRRRSRAALGSLAPAAGASRAASSGEPQPIETAATRAAPGRPEALERCVACHSSGVGPTMPFEDRERLAAALASGGYPHGSLGEEIAFRLSPAAGAHRMPLGASLSDEERSSLEAYFRGIGHTPATP